MGCNTSSPKPTNYPVYPQPTAPPLQTFPDHLQRLFALCLNYEIRQDFVAKLRQLESFEIVLLIDDSGSMNAFTSPGKTRWNEVQEYCNLVVNLAATLDSDGIDVFFLNRPGFTHITNSAQIAPAFVRPPGGFTPLSISVSRILQEKARSEKKILLIIATDGEPTTHTGVVDVPTFTRVLRERNANVFVSIIACTDDAECVGYLNKLDSDIPRLDVTDDYVSERREVLAAQGSNFHFSFGDYVVKSLLGSIDPMFDGLDEKRSGCFAH